MILYINILDTIICIINLNYNGIPGKMMHLPLTSLARLGFPLQLSLQCQLIRSNQTGNVACQSITIMYMRCIITILNKLYLYPN